MIVNKAQLCKVYFKWGYSEITASKTDAGGGGKIGTESQPLSLWWPLKFPKERKGPKAWQAWQAWRAKK